MAKKKCGDSQGWLATFADLMSLLMAIFVLLFSMSTLDADKYEAIVKSLTQTLGHGRDLTQTQVEYFKRVKEEKRASMDKQGETTLDQLKPLYESLVDTYSVKNQDASDDKNDIDVMLDSEKKLIKVTFPERISFPSGRANLKPAFIVELRKLRQHIEPTDQVKAVGHTDERPVVGGRFRSNWELSSARASAVIEQIISEDIAKPRQCQAVGVGPTQPLLDEAHAVAYAKNRRVEILIKPQPKVSLEEQVLGVKMNAANDSETEADHGNDGSAPEPSTEKEALERSIQSFEMTPTDN